MSCFCLASFVAQSRACFVEINPLIVQWRGNGDLGFVLPCYRGLARFLILFQIGTLIWIWHIQSVLKTWRASAKS